MRNLDLGFWNVLKEKHPEQMQQFCDWIDDYKKRDHAWIFDASGNMPKYHNLPLAMQIGVFSQFIFEQELHKLGKIAKSDLIYKTFSENVAAYFDEESYLFNNL